MHHGLVSVLAVNYGLGFAKLLTEAFNFLVVLSAYMLKFKLHSLFKVLSVLLNLPSLVLETPTLENFPLSVLSILS